MKNQERLNTQLRIINRIANASDSKNDSQSENVEVSIASNEERNGLVLFQGDEVTQEFECFQCFEIDEQNEMIYANLTDNDSPFMSGLLKGFNTTLITFGLSGRGKSHTLFGEEHIKRENNEQSNIVVSVYDRIKFHVDQPNDKFFQFSLSVCEIFYNEEENNETVIDLFDISNDKDIVLDFNNLLSVTFRSREELENLLTYSRMKSLNWTHSFNNDDQLTASKILPNESHHMIRLKVLSLKSSREYSFYIFDLIGRDPNNLETLAQISISHVEHFFEELIQNKANFENLRQKYQSGEKLNTRSGPLKALANNKMKIVNFISSALLNSQTFIYTPVFAIEPAQETIKILKLLSRLYGIQYSLKKTDILPQTRKKINFQTFLKKIEHYNEKEENERQAELYVNSGTSLSKNAKAILIDEGEQDKHDQEEKKGFSNDLNQKIQNDLKNIYQKFNQLNEVIEYGEIPEDPDGENMDSEKNSLRGSRHSNIVGEGKFSPDRMIAYQGSEVLKIKGSNRSLRSSPRSQPSQPRSPISDEDEKEHDERRVPSSAQTRTHEGNVYQEYERKVENVFKTLQSFDRDIGDIRTYSKTSKEGKGFHGLKKSYDLLLTLFEEGENVRHKLMTQFVELKDTLLEFKTSFELQLNSERLKSLELQKKLRLAGKNNDFSDLIDVYEKEIQKLTEEKAELAKENSKIITEFVNNSSLLNEKIVHVAATNIKNVILKRNQKLTKLLNEREGELQEVKKRERQVNSTKKVIENLSMKNVNLKRALDEKENLEKKVTETCDSIERENLELKRKNDTLEKEFKLLSEEFFKVKEQLYLFKEMAKTPPDHLPKKVLKPCQVEPKSLKSAALPGASAQSHITKQKEQEKSDKALQAQAMNKNKITSALKLTSLLD